MLASTRTGPTRLRNASMSWTARSSRTLLPSRMRLRITADACEAEVDWVAEPAAADDLAELADDRVEPLDVADGDLHARVGRRLEHLASLEERARDRLLDEHVLLHLHELENDVAVGRRRSRNNRCIEVDRPEARDVVVERRVAGGSRGRRPLRRRVDDTDELEVGRLAREAEVIAAHAADAQEDDAEFLSHEAVGDAYHTAPQSKRRLGRRGLGRPAEGLGWRRWLGHPRMRALAPPLRLIDIRRR